MLRILIAFIALQGLVFTPVLRQVEAACTKKQIKALKELGFSDSKIEQICSNDEEGFDEDDSTPPPGTSFKPEIKGSPSEWDESPQQQFGTTPWSSMSNRCMTQFGSCMLMQTGPVGHPCYCNSPSGRIPGMLQ
jgi:hypothetical protein